MSNQEASEEHRFTVVVYLDMRGRDRTDAWNRVEAHLTNLGMGLERVGEGSVGGWQHLRAVLGPSYPRDET